MVVVHGFIGTSPQGASEGFGGTGQVLITNVGVIDGVFRFVLGVGLLGLSYGWFRLHSTDDLNWAVWIIGALLGFTGLFRYCPAT